MSSLVPQRALGRWAYTMGVPAMQFRIALRDVAPEVWRRVELLSHGSFWDLHVALNTAMGWQDSHLHEFVLKHPITGEAARIGIPDPEGFDDHEVLPGWQVPLSEFIRTTGLVFEYHYDFGDGWIHDVLRVVAAARRSSRVVSAAHRRGARVSAGGLRRARTATRGCSKRSPIRRIPSIVRSSAGRRAGSIRRGSSGRRSSSRTPKGACSGCCASGSARTSARSTLSSTAEAHAGLIGYEALRADQSWKSTLTPFLADTVVRRSSE